MEKKITKATVLKFLQQTGEYDIAMDIRKKEKEPELLEGAKIIVEHLLERHGTFDAAVEARIKENDAAFRRLNQFFKKIK